MKLRLRGRALASGKTQGHTQALRLPLLSPTAAPPRKAATLRGAATAASATALMLHRKASGDNLFNGKLGPYSIVRGRADLQLLTWLQEDQTLPRSREQLERLYNYHKASGGAKSEDRNNETRAQVMGQTVGRSLGRCNGLDATQLMPERLVAFTRALKSSMPKLSTTSTSACGRRLSTDRTTI